MRTLFGTFFCWVAIFAVPAKADEAKHKFKPVVSIELDYRDRATAISDTTDQEINQIVRNFNPRAFHYPNKRHKPLGFELWRIVGDDGKFNGLSTSLRGQSDEGEDGRGWSFVIGGDERGSGLNLDEKFSAQRITGRPFRQKREWLVVAHGSFGW